MGKIWGMYVSSRLACGGWEHDDDAPFIYESGQVLTFSLKAEPRLIVRRIRESIGVGEEVLGDDAVWGMVFRTYKEREFDYASESWVTRIGMNPISDVPKASSVPCLAVVPDILMDMAIESASEHGLDGKFPKRKRKGDRNG